MSTLTAIQTLNLAVAGVLTRMTSGVVATLVLASLINALGLVPVLFGSVLGYVIIFAPLAMSLYLAWRGDSMNESTIKTWFFAFAAAMGLSLSLIFSIYTTASIAQALTGTPKHVSNSIHIPGCETQEDQNSQHVQSHL